MAPTRTLVAVFAAAALTLTGCASNSQGDSTLSSEDSPLSKYLSEMLQLGLSPDATPQERQAFANEQNRQVEDLVAKCMAKQGFEYIPNVDASSVEYTEDVYRPEDREWVEKYGYGMVNDPWQALSEAQPSPPADPNNAYVESLTDAERKAYLEALNGDIQEGEPSQEDQSQEYNWTTAGCYGAAQHEVQGDQPWQEEENKLIIQALQMFYEALPNDPAFAELDADWAACMTEKGYDRFQKQGEAMESILEVINKYLESASQDGGEQDESFGTMEDPEYAKLTEQEIPIALADLECRQKTDYRQQELRIRFAAEEQFIADHKQELDAFKARIDLQQAK